MLSPRIQRSLFVVIAAVVATACGPRAVSVGSPNDAGGPVAIDPQQVRDQDDMTYADYKPIPGLNWADPTKVGSKRTMRVAIVPADFDDFPFVLTRPKGSDLFGNPRVNSVTRDKVPQFYADFYGKVEPENHGHTIHEYWMEQSRGRIGVTVDAFGPYKLPFSYTRFGGLPQADIPFGGAPVNDNEAGRLLDSMWRADKGDSMPKKYDLIVRMYAGYDETATWQEFGEMKFQTQNDITPAFGNPDTTKKRWVRSRYVPWTSWMAGVWAWSNAGGGRITQGEVINSIRHEIAHAAFSIGDNYNNPYAEPYRRAHAGPWDLMDRGSFNGPFGPHHRFELPPNEGGSMSAGLMLRQRMYFGFVDSSQVLILNRYGLAKSGVAVVDVTARAVDPLPGTVSGILVRLDKATPQDTTPVDKTPFDDPAKNPNSSGTANFNTYTVEVAQRIGYDSYLPDNGVLLAKNKDRPSAAAQGVGMAIFTWAIDAHPQDIMKLDFKRPNGDPVMRTVGDYRQLNDALFHAGLNSGSTYEWEDTPNRLHFYVVDVHRNAQGILSYTLAVRSLDGASPQTHGVALAAPSSVPKTAVRSSASVTLTNTGTAAVVADGVHPRRQDAAFTSDVYRVSATVSGDGWVVDLENALAAVAFGKTQSIPVYIRRTASASPTATVTVTATSESDPSKTTKTTFTVSR